uniref:Uncharacterized protein n=1 Tax=Falco tinnunculus TaxID=100819 RepID=A0A8C4TZQ2_FALTI
ICADKQGRGHGGRQGGEQGGKQRSKQGVMLEVLDHLEHLALVDFRDSEGVERLQKAIQFADQLQEVNTDGVEPMDTVLEDRCSNTCLTAYVRPKLHLEISQNSYFVFIE